MASKQVKKRMTKQDKLDWDELYEYVRQKVMGYDTNQSLSKNMVLRLKGMLNGKFYANNNTKDVADYSYKNVLNTYKFCSLSINRVFTTKSFESEEHKFNYAAAIVESKLNDVYMRMKNVVKSEEKTKNMDMSTATNEGAEYQKKTKENNNKRLDDLW